MTSRRSTRAFAFLLAPFALAAPLAACGDGGSAGDDTVADASTAPTYYRDIKPIMDGKCTQCHFDGGIAPFALTSYDEAKAHAAEASLAVAAGLMPPWPPNPDCNQYYADRSLSAAQKELIQAWSAAGAPEGDAAHPGDPIDVERTALTRVDVRIEPPTDFTPTFTAEAPDQYRCFVIPWPADHTSTEYITGFRAVPGAAAEVHHVIAYYAAPGDVATYQQLDADEPGDGYTCFGGPGGPSRGEWLGGWAPGSAGSDYEPGTGLKIEPGAAVILQVHYNGLNVLDTGALPDRTAVEFKVDPTVEREAMIMPWANPQWLDSQSMTIPAGDADVMHAFQFDPTPFLTGGQGFTIYSPGLHMHNLGRRATASIVRAGGASECLLQIDDWNFHWQGGYDLRTPVHFAPGDQLRVECHWDNSAENQPIIGGQQQPPHDVWWGDGTTDEMCLATFYVAVDNP
ncbi:MAG: monooxygenase [Myxococcales bacterium]|nr:monooxygenase [Myxococcales bacterium]